MANVMSLIGDHYGSWTVLGPYRRQVLESGSAATMWYCKCVCGTEKWVSANNLRNGKSKACQECGVEKHRKYPKEMAYTVGYFRRRNDCGYHDGTPWKDDFYTFVATFGQRPEGKYLVPADKSKPISGDNFKWADTYDKHNKGGPPPKYTFPDGTTRSLDELGKIVGVSRERMRQRINHQVALKGEIFDQEDLMRPPGAVTKYILPHPSRGRKRAPKMVDGVLD